MDLLVFQRCISSPAATDIFSLVSRLARQTLTRTPFAYLGPTLVNMFELLSFVINLGAALLGGKAK